MDEVGVSVNQFSAFCTQHLSFRRVIRAEIYACLNYPLLEYYYTNVIYGGEFIFTEITKYWLYFKRCSCS